MSTDIVDVAIPQIDAWLQLERCREELGQKRWLLKLASVFELQNNAIGYVQGWQDRGGERDDAAVWHFGVAYGLQVAEFELGRRTTVKPIHEAFKDWQAYGELR